MNSYTAFRLTISGWEFHHDCLQVPLQNLSSLIPALWTIGFLAFVEVVSLTLQVLSARLFKVDADTAVIASVTYINSPPFVPMIAASMKNRRPFSWERTEISSDAASSPFVSALLRITLIS